MKKIVSLVMGVLLMAAAAGCQVAAPPTSAPASTVTPAEAQERSPQPATAQPNPSATPQATSGAPQNTAEPENTALPTENPVAKATPTEKESPPSPTDTAAPLALQAPVVSNSQVDGEPNGLIGQVDFSPDSLMRMNVHASEGSQDGDGIEQVTFTISNANGKVYERTERNPGYCVFGGGEPTCNAWPHDDYQFVWGADGPPVEAGDYSVAITAQPKSADGDESQFGRWFFTITVALP